MSKEQVVVDQYELSVAVNKLAVAFAQRYEKTPPAGIEAEIAERTNTVIAHGAKTKTVTELDAVIKKIVAGVYEVEKMNPVLERLVHEVITAKIEEAKKNGSYHVHFEMFRFDDE